MLVLNCSEWVEIGSWRRSRDEKVAGLRDGAASALACAGLGRLSRKLRKAAKHMRALDPQARHRARIKAKKLRYAAEFFAETFGRHSKAHRSKFIASLAKLQDALGDLNDLTVAHQTLLEAAGENAALAFRSQSSAKGGSRLQGLAATDVYCAPRMDDVVGLSGHERHVESVEHDAGLQIGREGPSDDPARPRVENDREVEKSGQLGRKVMSATHNAFGRSAAKLRRTRSLAR
jgi:hypothetical protein